MSIRSLLKTDNKVLLKCHPEDTLQTVSSLMSSNRVSALPVLDQNNNLIGIIAVWDIMVSFANIGEDIAKQTVADVMTNPVVTCSPDKTLSQAIALMGNHKISNIVIVDDTKIYGTLSSRDVLRALHEKEELEINILKDIAIAARH